MEKELKRGAGYVELGVHVVVRTLGLEVGLGVTVLSVGRVAADVGTVVIVAEAVVGAAPGAEVTLCPMLCYKTSNYFLSSRSLASRREQCWDTFSSRVSGGVTLFVDR